VTFEIQDGHFPALASVSGRTIQVTKAKLLLKTSAGAGTDGMRLMVDGETAEKFEVDEALGKLRVKDLGGAFRNALRGKHTMVLGAPGVLEPTPPVRGGAVVDQVKLVDVMFYVEYRV
jgi:hypothetical protein